MKYFIYTILCFFSLKSFAQHDMHPMNMSMKMPMKDSSYLPRIISHALIKSWGPSNLFKTAFDTSSLVYLTGEQEHIITIKAFQHKFYDDPKVLKPVWVLGYVSKENNNKPSLPGPVIISEYAHPTKVYWVNKVYETLQNQPDYQLYPTYDTLKAHPFVPIVYNVNDPMHVHMVANTLYPDFREFPTGVDPMHDKYMEMSTYYSTTVHLHGANVTWQNDGYPTSRYYPKPDSTPVNITWGLFGKFEQNKKGQHYVYPNTFPEGEFNLIKNKMYNIAAQNNDTKYQGHHGAILWYHDHAMMRTATDVYSGQAGVYIIKGEDEKSFSSIVQYKHDIPLLLADKAFTESSYLYYNTTTSIQPPPNANAPESEGQPEYFGNTITVNGKIWPYMDVEKAVYRFRIVNASNSRFYRIALAKWKNGKIDTTNNLKLSKSFIQIGTEGGFFPDGNFPRIGNDSSALTLAPAERADVLINFSSFDPGTSLVLLNYAPDGPFGDDEITAMNANGTFDDLTNYIMLFRVSETNAPSSTVSEAALDKQLANFSSSTVYKKTTSSQYLYSYYKNNNQFKTDLQKGLEAVSNDSNKIQPVNKNALVALFPKESDLFNGADVYKLKISEAANYDEMPGAYKKFIESDPMLKEDLAFPMAFLNGSEWNLEAHTGDSSDKKLYEKVVNNYATEIWEIWNSTGDAHPIHLHLNRFRVLGRQLADNTGRPVQGATGFILPEPNEMGWKDVIRAKPGYITYIIVQFILNDSSQEGHFVYHCHILEHEDMSMMRRLVVLPNGPGKQYILALDH